VPVHARALANALAGIMSGATFVDAAPQPAPTRIVMIRFPGAAAGALEPTNRYLDPADEPLVSDLGALGVPAEASAGLDALLGGFLRGDRAGDYIKLDASEYSRLALAIDRSSRTVSSWASRGLGRAALLLRQGTPGEGLAYAAGAAC
jgi:hypothetical protein